MPVKKVLLIGGAGFIGLRIAQFLSEERTACATTIIDNFFRGKEDEYLIHLRGKYNIKVIQADCTQPAAFDTLDKDYDHVYMLASVVGVEYTTQMPDEIIRINTALIYNTLEWLKTASCGKVVFTSTSECYAGTIEAFNYAIPTPEKIPLCIEDIRHPRFTYAVTKMLGESGFMNYARVHGFKCTVVRYHNVYGERMGFKHVIPQVTQRFYNKENPFKIYGADQTRAFCYVDDAVEGTVLSMEQDGADGEIIHIGVQDEIKIEEIVKYIGTLVGFDGAYEAVPAPDGSVSRRCPDISKAKRLLGYQPRVDYKTGVKRTFDWYMNYLKTGKKAYE
jgi:nucleoside-diphosphate-sugar epimerase